eukprot:7275664-Prymnesium_polylepis.1
MSTAPPRAMRTASVVVALGAAICCGDSSYVHIAARGKQSPNRAVGNGSTQRRAYSSDTGT